MPFFEMLLAVFQRFSWSSNRPQSTNSELPVCQNSSPEYDPILPSPTEGKPGTTSILDTLPPELIIYIARFLPLSSTVSFTLCCRSRRDILGTGYWKSLHAEDQQRERMAFLSLLEKDLPDYIPCHHCQILHVSRTYQPGCSTESLTRSRTACHKEELLGGVFTYIHKAVTFRTLQMTMKRFRQGLDYSYHLGLLVGGTMTRRLMRDFPCHCAADARITNGSLFLRVQYLILIPPNRSVQSLARCLINICPHTGIVAQDHGVQLPVDIDCKINHQHDLKQCIRQSELKQCRYCPTEYKLGVEECENVGVVTVITKWLELGAGKTVLDPRWWSHLSKRYTDSHVFAEASAIHGKGLEERPSVQLEGDSIRGSFEEGNSTASHTSLTPEILDTLSRMLG